MKKTLIYAIALILIGLAIFFIWKQNRVPSVGINNDNADLQEEEWLSYENTVYKYKFSYPGNALVTNAQEMDSRPTNESNDIQIFIPGSVTSVSIFAFTKDQSLYAILAPDQTGINSNSLLKDIADKVRKNQIDDKNPNIQNKKVGDMKETVFAGEKAYSFTLTGGFATNLTGMGYAITGTHKYIFVEKNNTKFVIHYPLEDNVSEKIINSFEFNK